MPVLILAGWEVGGCSGVMLTGCWGVWVVLPSSLAHPAILLLFLSPVLNSVAMATMSTTFQLPRDGLRRRREGGKREPGEGGGG